MSTHINHIEINNFKSIQHQVIDGCKKINVFIGQPNVGKSAILEALSLSAYLQPNYKDFLDKLCRLKLFNELFTDGNIKLNASIAINQSFKGELVYGSEKELEFTFYQQDKKLRSIVFDRKSITRDAAVTPTSDSNEPQRALTCKKYIFQNKHFNDHKTDALNLQFPDGENLVDIIQFNKELRKEVIDLFKVSGLLVNIDQGDNSIRGYKQLEEGLVFTIPFYQMADTLQRLIFHKAAILSNKDAVLLFEEPEAHMFPPYISKFTGDVIFDDNNNQFFIATHSPYVLSDFIENDKVRTEELSVYVVGMADGQTIVKRLTDEQLLDAYQYSEDLFFNIESYL